MSLSYTTSRVVFPEPQHHWSSAEGNPLASARDTWRKHEPQPFGIDHDPRPEGRDCGVVIAYLVPGQRVPVSGQRYYAKVLNRSAPYRKRGEIEFSAPVGASTPDRYRRSAMLWALSVSDAVLVCVDTKPGVPEGEAHRVLAPRQCVFRCREADVGAWVDHLRPKLLPRHTEFAVVHLPTGHA